MELGEPGGARGLAARGVARRRREPASAWRGRGHDVEVGQRPAAAAAATSGLEHGGNGGQTRLRGRRRSPERGDLVVGAHGVQRRVRGRRSPRRGPPARAPRRRRRALAGRLSAAARAVAQASRASIHLEVAAGTRHVVVVVAEYLPDSRWRSSSRRRTAPARRRARPGVRSRSVSGPGGRCASASPLPAGPRGRPAVGGHAAAAPGPRGLGQPAPQQVGVVGAGGLLGDRRLGLEGARGRPWRPPRPRRRRAGAAAPSRPRRRAHRGPAGQVGVVLGAAHGAAAADRQPAGQLGRHPVDPRLLEPDQLLVEALASATGWLSVELGHDQLVAQGPQPCGRRQPALCAGAPPARPRAGAEAAAACRRAPPRNAFSSPRRRLGA